LNTIDKQATYEQDGAQVRASGPIGCTRGERITIRVSVRQAGDGSADTRELDGALHGRGPALAGAGPGPQ
jgi:hypothetical protein